MEIVDKAFRLPMKCGLALLGMSLILGCTHRISIHGEGRIESMSAERNCSHEVQPCSFVISDAYDELYRPVPAEGFSFSHWTGCLTNEGSSCRFRVNAEVNRNFWGETFDSSATFLPSFRRIVNSAGVEFESDSDAPSVSADGRYIVFSSIAENVISGVRDINGVFDVYLFDAHSGALRLLSRALEGQQSDGNSRSPVISADGQFVAWQSAATNMVVDDANGTLDIFLYNLATDEISRISIAHDGAEADGASQNPAISADGMVVAFESEASNLVPGDVNLAKDIFIRDINLSSTERVSVDSSGDAGIGRASFSSNATLSAAGDLIAFDSFARLSADDRNGDSDIYLRDRVNAVTKRISSGLSLTDANGSSSNPSCDQTCGLIAFDSTASNLVADDANGIRDVFLFDAATSVTSMISRNLVDDQGANGANGQSLHPVITGDGRWVAFESLASNLIAGDTNQRRDIFIGSTRGAAELSRVSESPDGLGGDSDSKGISIDEKGRTVAFHTFATNLSDIDLNGASDVYLRRMER